MAGLQSFKLDDLDCLSDYLSIYLLVSKSTGLSDYLSPHLSVSVSLITRLSDYLSVCRWQV